MAVGLQVPLSFRKEAINAYNPIVSEDQILSPSLDPQVNGKPLISNSVKGSVGPLEVNDFEARQGQEEEERSGLLSTNELDPEGGMDANEADPLHEVPDVRDPDND
jgi:hypothetical protein